MTTHPTFPGAPPYAEGDGLVSPESCMEEDPAYNIGIPTSRYGIIYGGDAYRAVVQSLAEGL